MAVAALGDVVIEMGYGVIARFKFRSRECQGFISVWNDEDEERRCLFKNSGADVVAVSWRILL